MSLATLEARPREETNALFGDNKLKLGLFGINCNNGCAMTTVDEALQLTWDSTKEIAQTADRAGFEALVPVARWKGLGGENNFNGRNFETYTWAAGLAEATDHITLVTTSHVQTIHPIMAAKQAATIDHISGGRYCMNIVTGWFHPELEMFGARFMEHDSRYDYATEWWEVVKRLWIEEEEFSFEGEFFKIDGGFAMPKPIQKPRPPAINAGGSKKGREFIAAQADVGFVVLTDHNDLEVTRKVIDEQRAMAAEHGREIQVWTHGYVVQRDSEQEAQDYLDYFANQHGNEEAGETAARFLGLNSEIMSPEAWETFKLHLKAGYGGYGMVGTADQVAEKLAGLSEIGIDGVALHWVDYIDGLRRFNADVLPSLEQAGLRKSYQPAAS
jgi:alkanesulfonate monooxygenase SsuD/methylene tetrahydromethanopterin reductase-like flavin-dependent oxidoreductase (luciferase family)